MRRLQSVILSVTVLVAVGYLAWCLRGQYAHDQAARSRGCMLQMRRIATGLLVYHDYYGCFPPHVVRNAAGTPVCSWRVLLTMQHDPPRRYPLDDTGPGWQWNEPWSSATNQAAASDRVGFTCRLAPHFKDAFRNNKCSYFAVVGEGTAWPDHGCITLDDIKDDRRSTILAVECAAKDAHWAEPWDLDVANMSFRVNAEGEMGISNTHGPDGRVVFASEDVGFLPFDTPPEVIRAMLTIAGGEELEQVKDAKGRMVWRLKDSPKNRELGLVPAGSEKSTDELAGAKKRAARGEP